jgi:hypothetical protein
MNILFGALLIVMILLPGVIFRASYLHTAYGKKTFRSSFLDELLLSVVPTLLIQVLGYSAVELILQNVDEHLLYLLIINNDKAIEYGLSGKSVFLFSLYNLCIYIVSWYMGSIARKVVIRRKLDIKYPILRLHNDWHYIFSGLMLDFPGQPGDSNDVSTIWVDVLVESKAGEIIYSGFLEQYVLSKEDGLDRIYLTAVRRRRFTKEEQGANPAVVNDDVQARVDSDSEESTLATDDRYYFMPGDYFIIPYKEIKNLNVIYYREQELADQQEA